MAAAFCPVTDVSAATMIEAGSSPSTPSTVTWTRPYITRIETHAARAVDAPV